jgi:Cupin domain
LPSPPNDRRALPRPHHREDEAFVLLEGEITVYVGNAVIPLAAGETALGPRGVPHTFSVDSETARWLAVCTPAGFERFVAAAGEPAAEPVLPDTPVAPSPEALAAIAGEYGIELLGLPGALPS